MHQHIVFVGAGGAGVSSLVLLFQELGIPNILAIDSHESELTEKIRDAGIEIIIGHGIYQVQQDDIIIYSDAAMQSPEVIAATQKISTNHKRIFPPMSYFQFLGEISKYMQTIAIMGTHGKSTTTALTATVLAKHHQNFGLGIVGAPINQRGHRNSTLNTQHQHAIKNILEHILFPKSPDISVHIKQYLFVIEADEYNHHFLHLDIDYAIVTNIELDHADVYEDFDDYLSTFISCLQKVRHTIFALPSAAGIQALIASYPERQKKGVLVEPKHFPFTHLLGAHNHANASLAYACGTHVLEDASTPKDIETTLSTFAGLRRRGELLGHTTHDIPVISDYGHHPTELASTLVALREKYPNEHITCIFQPHQARRVMEFWHEFIGTLRTFEQVIIYDIYAAREDFGELKKHFSRSNENKRNLTHTASFAQLKSIDDLGNKFAQEVGGTYTHNFKDIQHALDKTSEGVIIVFSAGDLDWKIRKNLGSIPTKNSCS